MTIQQFQPWVQLLAALLTPVIALLAASITWQQWKTNRNKLKLDLFERRYAYYEAATTLISKVVGGGKASDDDIYQYLVKVKGAKFIVGKEVAEYLDETLYRKASQLTALHSELESISGAEERKENVRRQREIKDWIQSQYNVLDQKFGPLLRLSH